ncbi:MAG: S1C family serine protease [Mycobacterium sp.]
MRRFPQKFGRRWCSGIGALAVLATLAPVHPASAEPVDLLAIAEQTEPAVVEIDTRLDYQGAIGNGTGVVIGGGQVLTNFHVVQGADAITATVGGSSYPAVLLGFDRQHDIALIELQGGGGVPSASLGDSSPVAIGDPVVAIGNHDGTNGSYVRSLGEVTELGRDLAVEDAFTGNQELLTDLIGVAADVRAGDSGGALVNADGEVIGVITAATVTFRMDPAGAGYAIPINTALGIANQIRSGAPTDSVHIGPPTLLGVGVTVSDQSDYGLVIGDVITSGPASTAGLMPGDVLTAVNGSPVDSATALTTILDRLYPGDVVELVWLDQYGEERTGKAPLYAG